MYCIYLPCLPQSDRLRGGSPLIRPRDQHGRSLQRSHRVVSIHHPTRLPANWRPTPRLPVPTPQFCTTAVLMPRKAMGAEMGVYLPIDDAGTVSFAHVGGVDGACLVSGR